MIINTYAIQDEYMFGPDMLVAPVHKKDVKEWQVYLPAGQTWVNIWNMQEIQGGQSITIDAPIENHQYSSVKVVHGLNYSNGVKRNLIIE